MENDANPNPAPIQPMDQNVIQNIKLGYRNLLLTNILNDPVHYENLEKALKNLMKICKLKKFSLHHSLTNYKTRTRCLILKSSSGLLRLTTVWLEILTDDEIIRTVTAEDDDDDDVTPVNRIKISHSEAGAALNTSLQWAEEQNFEAHKIILLRHLRDRVFQLKIGTAAQRKTTDFFRR
ncbi:hypothetical protein AVEN_244536-1 [Araneus ventricosus]|uniref:Uncharacterized protein n=1 Tax=Araneus ventricosus TaxID=182803 RepID=A0A4Y2F6G6_ARAVE|nr:hypothetical protein AVEN_244536-1 [Araneus ventricosus]